MNRTAHVRTVDQLRTGDHVCLLFETEAERRSLLTAFIRLGLEANQKVICGIDGHSVDGLVGHLHENGIEVQPYVSSGQLVFMPCAEMHLQEGVFRAERVVSFLDLEAKRALEQGYSALRLTREASRAIGGSPGCEELVECELRLSSCLPRTPCLGLCLYDRREFSPKTLQDVLFTHPTVAVGTELFENVCLLPPGAPRGASREQAKLAHQLENLVRHGRMREEIQESRDRLRRSEREMRTIAENVPALILYVDAGGRYRYVNRQYERWFGVGPAQIIGKRCRDVLGAEAYARIEKHVDAALGGRQVHFEDHLPYPRGGRRWVMAEYVPDTDEHGKVRGFLALVTDITEQKRSQQVLRERVKARTCLCQVHRAIQEDLSIEKLCERIVGHLSSAMQFPEITVAAIELAGRRFGDERLRQAPLHGLSARIGANGQTYGEVRVSYHEDKFFLLPEEQDLLDAVADILGVWFADRQTREELTRSRSSLNEAQKIGHLGSWEWDIESGSLSWSDELYRIFGVRKELFHPTYQAIETMVHPDDRAHNARKVQEMLSRSDRLEYELRIVRPDGKIRHVLQTVEVARTSDGKAQRLLGTIQDITERKQFEQELGRRAEELRQLSSRLVHAREQERASIARELHDELGQALTAVRINVSQLEKGLQRRIPREAMERLHETGELADQLLRQTRDLALSLRPNMLDDLGLISTLRWYAGRFAERAGIGIDLDVDGREQGHCESLRTLIYRTVQEALTNVARHAQASRVIISLKFGPGDVTLRIKDDGKGFDVAQACGIESERPHFGLLGMRESVEGQGGGLVVESSPGRGTSITVNVPFGESP